MAKPSMPVIRLNSIPALQPIKEEQPSQTALALPPPLPVEQGRISPVQSVIKTKPQSPPQPQQQQEEPKETQIFKSINELGALSVVIQEFKLRFDELRSHLDFIGNAIDSRLNNYSVQQQEQQDRRVETQLVAVRSATGIETEVPTLLDKTVPETVPKSSPSEIQYLCKTMCSRGLRKYIVAKLSDIGKLRQEAPAALKLAPAPAKLVLDCIGRFYLQGKKAYTTDSPMIPAREASVLILEFFLLTMRACGEGVIEIDKSVKEEAETGAISWRKRLISEGGLANACEIDARGLLLFIACFGIPKAFRSEDISHLFRLANPMEISDALKGSRVLLSRMPDIINGMVKSGMPVEAIDVAFVMGLEDKFSPQTILTSFLQDSKEALNKKRQEAGNSPAASKQGKEKQLTVLRSIVKYVEARNDDLTKILGAWQIEDKIIKLEKEIANLDKRRVKSAISKRRLDETGSSGRVWHSQEIKRPRFAVTGSSSVISPHVNGLHEKQLATYPDNIRSYDGLLQNSSDIGISAHVNSYPTASSLPYGSSVVAIHAAGVAGGVVTAAGALTANSYPLAHRETLTGQVGQTVASSDQAYGWHEVDAKYDASVYGQSSVGQSASVGANGTYVGLPSESYAGLQKYPNVIAATRASASDLYRFADAVVETESYGVSSHRTGTVPSIVHVRHSSYMY